MSRDAPSVSETDLARSPLDRFLGIFSDVRAGEGANALLLALNVFLILTAYYVLKPIREALILGQGSAELKSYLSAGQVVLIAIAVPIYSRLAARLPRQRLINLVTVFFAGCLVVFFALGLMGVPLGIVFFLWIGVFNLMIVAQFWSFANDIYNSDEGERLFPLVAFGASLGAVLGAVVTGRLIEPIGIYPLMLVGAALLLAEVQITNYVDRRERRRKAAQSTAPDGMGVESIPCNCEVPEPDFEGKPDIPSGSFSLVFRNRYLLLIALMLLFLNWVNTTGEYILASVVAGAARDAVAAGASVSVEQFIGRFYSNFFGIVNVAGLVIQLFLVSRIIKRFGVGLAVMVLPVLALGAYGLLAFYPVLGAVRWAKTAENATDYSLNNTVRNMLFLPTTRAEKYSAKQAIDSFFVRAGDVLSAGMVFVGTAWLAWSPTGFAMANMVLVGFWLVFAVLIGREYRKRTEIRLAE